MSKLFRIHQYYSNYNSCHMHRMLYPARYLGQFLRENYDIEIRASAVYPDSPDDIDCFMWQGIPRDMDFIMRALVYRQKGKTLVWNVDDDYTCIPASNPIKMTDQALAGVYWATNMSTYILASTQHLATKVNRPSNVAPNMIECPEYECNPREKIWGDTVRIVWMGSNTHSDDLAVLVEPITKIIEKYGKHVEILFHGDCHPEIRRRHLFNGVIETTGCPLVAYYDLVRQQTPDIWLCPLVDNEFNRSKSNLKMLEGMATGAAVLASPVEPYLKTVQDGNSILIVDPDMWTTTLEELIENTEFRKKVGANGKQFVNDNFNWYNAECYEPWITFYRGIAGKL